jgi:hypothetical protein
LLCSLLLLLGLAALARLGPARSAPVPPPRELRFLPVSPAWVVQVNYLLPYGDPPDGFTVVAPAKRDPAFRGYSKELSYHAGAPGKGKPIKIVRYFPSGKVAQEIDNVGADQHSRSFHANGRVACYLHWREGKWLAGHSTSPDGKVVHRLDRGRGEIVTYGGPGAFVHRWYHDASPFLEKAYRDGKLVSVRLNDVIGSLSVSASAEWLILRFHGENWHRAPGSSGLRLVAFDNRPRFDEGKLYEQRREEFIKACTRTLRAAGKDWKELGIDFIPRAAPWPGPR